MNVESLSARLSALDGRLRRPELRAIAEALGDERSLVPKALQWLREGQAQVLHLEQEIETLAAAYNTSKDRQILLNWLRKQQGGRLSWRERWAPRLGMEVMRERNAMAIAQLEIREELILKILAGQLPIDAPLPSEILDCLMTGRRWLVRKAAAECVLHYLNMGGKADIWQQIHARAQASQEHPWVRDACDAILVVLDKQRAQEHLCAGVIPAPEPRHFLIRRLRVERMAATWPESAVELLKGVVRDPSEHVGIGLALALAQVLSKMSHPGVFDLLKALSQSPLARVRLAVAESLSAEHPEQSAALLIAAMQQESESMVLKGLARASMRIAEAQAGLGPSIRAALDGVIAADQAGESTEAAARARQLCVRLQEPESQALFQALQKRILEIPAGGKKYYSWKTLGCQAVQADPLGRILAELAHEDMGLWADVGAGGITLWRGDRFQMRLWRIWHELTHPAPNKRQNWSHTIARVVRGALRAPPTRMAEVTATTTPGERTIIDRDGSWVPALPTVNDILDLPGKVSIYSAFGKTEVVPPASLLKRVWNRVRLTWMFPKIARLRSASIAAEESSERAMYVRTLEKEFGVTVNFQLDTPAPRRLRELSGHLGIGPLLAWLSDTQDAILAPSQASQPALAWFTTALLAMMLTRAAHRRDQIRQARAAIPLVMGGWGTRGKSGTERIKAGLFHGLGFPVFVKTTGCEAMFISARPGLIAKEIFIFRPHDKSSIWEQADMVEQAAGMGARVMLWECMALRPSLVELLEQDWMTDDMVTLTNAFPDHEDMQGPAGHDIATVISSFMPRRSVAVTSEREFLPIFRERARERGSELDVVETVSSELLGQDLLDLFPYQEHPRNIALVARVAERLGLDRHLAIVTMAEHVVPDLGVLRIYPQTRVHGRLLRFINGMSANERTGCVTNWRRTHCDQIDVDRDLDQALVVVVNNRADRVARSEVFARIMVQDLTVDAFVLIGTNLTGLQGYVKTALDNLLRDVQLRPEGSSPASAGPRLSNYLARLRIARPSIAAILARTRVLASGLGRNFVEAPALVQQLQHLFEDAQNGLEIEEIVHTLRAHERLHKALDESMEQPSPLEGPPEVAQPPDLKEVWHTWVEVVARQLLHARLLKALDENRLDDIQFRNVFKSVFLRNMIVIEDRHVSGDRIISRVAQSVMPGLRVTVMGVQNIKGTGLDFAYRWVALGIVQPHLDRAQASDAIGRKEALRTLLNFDDYGLVDSGAVAQALATPAAEEDEETQVLRMRVWQKVSAIHQQRLNNLSQQLQRRWWMPIVEFAERMVDPLDAIRRYWIAQRTMRELRDHTVSLSEAALTLQGLYARQKGGWLVKWLATR